MDHADQSMISSVSEWADSLGPAVLEPLSVIDNALREAIARLGLPGNLREAIEYALLAEGKRVRPLLAWHSCEAVGGKGSWALGAAVAVELIHAFSLVHDDLPAMDDDDLRRGRATLHIAHGEAMAILAGDAMLPIAFEVLTTTRIADMEDSARQSELRCLLSQELAAGSITMIVGQVFDTLDGDDEATSDIDRLERIHQRKTGALIRASCRMGAWCGLFGSDQPKEGALDAITRYAESLGQLFQITDDLLDVQRTTIQVGKRTGKDKAAGKLTYPGVLGIDETKACCNRIEREAIEAIEPIGESANALRAIVKAVAVRTH